MQWDYLYTISILGPAYNEQKDAKETARYKWALIVTELLTLQSINLMQRNLLAITGCLL